MSEAHCPFCGRLQPPLDQPRWRCPSCNLFLGRKDLVLAGEAPRLESESRDFCPWCAYPVAREFSLDEDLEFACPGCFGTLDVGLLVTQSAIEQYRKKRLDGRGFLLFAMVLIATIALFSWILST